MTNACRLLTAGLAGALLLIPAWSAAASDSPPTPVKIKVAVLEGTQLFPMYVMRTKGFAEKHQLQIEQVKAAGPQGLYTIMQTGDFHIGFGGWLSIALMRAQGHKLTNVFSTSRYSNEVMVPIASPLQSFADLKGKRIGIFGGPTAATTWFFRLQVVKFFGFDPMRDAKIHYGAPPLLMGMLEQGELDAILSLDPQIVQMLETGKFRSIGNLGETWRTRTGQDPLLLAVTVNETWAKQNPGVVKRFVAAFKESLDHLRTHPEVWPELARSVGIQTEPGVRWLRERSNLVSRWDQTVIDAQHAYAAEVVKTFGDAAGIPKQIPEGTFDLSYAQ
jgi:NitT/TauT family transport system substrate-binding protein